MEQNQKKQITVSAVLACLQEGMLRKEMAAHFGIPQSELARHFLHPKLKGKRPNVKPTSYLVDDTVDENQLEMPFPQQEAAAVQPPAGGEAPEATGREEAKQEEAGKVETFWGMADPDDEFGINL